MGFPRKALVLTVTLWMNGPADARPLHVRDSFPRAEAILDGRNAQYVIRFDSLVDHAASQIEIISNGKVVETLVPVGDSAPDVLAASAPALAQGKYRLYWHRSRSPTAISQMDPSRSTVKR